MRALILIPTLVLLACGSPTDPGVRVLATVGMFFPDDPSIEVPDSVDAGVPFEIRVRTYGDGCTGPGPTEVVVTPDATVVSPYNFHDGGPICDASLTVLPHAASVTLHTPGTARLVVRGHLDPPGVDEAFEYDVWVR